MKHHRRRQHQRRRLSRTTTAGAEFILIFNTVLNINVEKFRDEKIISV